jgi:hypothetical protein
MDNHDLTKNIKIQKITYKEKEYIDIRFYFNDKPTKKGIRFSRSALEKLILILNNLLNNNS